VNKDFSYTNHDTQLQQYSAHKTRKYKLSSALAHCQKTNFNFFISE